MKKANCAALFLLCLSLVGCVKKKEATPPPPSSLANSPEGSGRRFQRVVDFAYVAKELSMMRLIGSVLGDVTILLTPGPFTVFAPVNSAFEEIPKPMLYRLWTHNDRIWPAIFWHHFARGLYPPEQLRDGQVIRQMDGEDVVISLKEGKPAVNGNLILATIHTGNGIVYEIDKVLLPRIAQKEILRERNKTSPAPNP